jgi:hypothetical protein
MPGPSSLTGAMHENDYSCAPCRQTTSVKIVFYEDEIRHFILTLKRRACINEGAAFEPNYFQYENNWKILYV